MTLKMRWKRIGTNSYNQMLLRSHNMICSWSCHICMPRFDQIIDSERAMGSQCCGTINNNSERLVNFCLNNNCAIGGTIFQHQDIHKLTWKSPDGKKVNQIDHVAINNKWRRSLKDVHISSGEDHSRMCTHAEAQMLEAIIIGWCLG